jgi:hypothetical protein
MRSPIATWVVCAVPTAGCRRLEKPIGRLPSMMGLLPELSIATKDKPDFEFYRSASPQHLRERFGVYEQSL